MQSKMCTYNKNIFKKLIMLLIALLFSIYSSNAQDVSIYHTKLDTVHIKTGIIEYDGTEMILSYGKYDYNEMIDNHPEFVKDWTYNVKQAYHKHGGMQFVGEAGEDFYHLVYAHFMKKKNENKKIESEREALIEIFREINDMHGSIQGGTWFGHQYMRIMGIVEDELEEMLYRKERYDSKEKYSITKQKALFIASLRQFCEDELRNYELPT